MKNTWDLTLIFKNDEEFEKEYNKQLENIDELLKYKGKLSKKLKEYLDLKEKKTAELYKLYDYGSLNHDANTSDPKYQEMDSRVSNLLSNFFEGISFENSEIIENEKEIRKLMRNEDMKDYLFYLEEIFESKKHILSEPEEQILASFSSIESSPHETFSSLNDTDLKFNDVNEKNYHTLHI